MVRRLIDDEERLIRGSGEPDRQRGNDERESLSWRDRDRKKDRSVHASTDPRERIANDSSRARYQMEQQRKGNLAAANALFSNSGKEALEKKILSASPDAVGGLIDEYLKQYETPTEFDLLVRFLDHPSVEIVTSALERLEPLLPQQETAKRNSLLRSVKLLSMMGRDPDARRAASSFLRKSRKSDVQT